MNAQPLMQLDLIRFVAIFKPLIAASRVCERIIMILKNVMLSTMPTKVASPPICTHEFLSHFLWNFCHSRIQIS